MYSLILLILLCIQDCNSLRYDDLTNLPGLPPPREDWTPASRRSRERTDMIKPTRTRDTLSTTFRSLFNHRCSPDTHGWYHHILGHFHRTPEYCDASCMRDVICCTPETPEELRVNFYLSTPHSPYPLRVDVGDYHARNLLRESPRPVVIIVHGFLNHHIEDSIWNETRDAHLMRGSNVILVDWNRGNRLYPQSMANVRVVGALLGRLLEYLTVSEKSECVGFSLGAHICGEAGSWLRKHSMTLDRCVGIDPAGPGFDGCSHLQQVTLDKSDCRVVRIIHTSQFLGHMDGFGSRFKSGHCDYWINDALRQPGCTHERSLISIEINSRSDRLFASDLMPIAGISCAHNRAMKIYLSQVRRDCDFRGDEADECGNGRLCVPLSPSMRMSLPPDDSCTPYSDVDLLVETTASQPFC